MKTILSLMLLLAWPVEAAKFLLFDSKGQALENAVVWLSSEAVNNTPEQASQFEMKQQNRAFMPHVLVVPKGAQVAFPNLDSIMHHVYSFSEAKQFELKLYRDTPKQPVVFNNTGVVELGCNIHDWMLGYIVVVDSPYFAKSNAQGEVTLAVPTGEYQLNVWHDRFSDISKPEDFPVELPNEVLKVQIQQPLLEKIVIESDEFDDYE